MKYYVPSLTAHWGDNITALWASEMLSQVQPGSHVVLDSTFYENKRRENPYSIREWIKIDWAQEGKFDVPAATELFDGVVATHHRHRLPVYQNVNGEKLLFFDAHGLTYRMMRDDWYPTFQPTDRMLEEFAKAKLPEEYVVVHVNDDSARQRAGHRPDGRNVLFAQTYFEQNINELRALAKDHVIVTTGTPIDPSIVPAIRAEPLPGWVKLYAMIKAKFVWGSLSGFTSIAATYRRGSGVTAVNEPAIHSFNMGPPNLAYDNYGIADFGSYDKLCYAIEQGIIPNSTGTAYARRSNRPHWCQFENFDFDDFDHIVLPRGYKAKPFYEHIENCLVPLDVKYTAKGTDKLWDFRYDDAMTSLIIMSWIPKPKRT